MGKTAFLFPGQGSQQVGMGKDLYEQIDVSKKIMDQANETLGIDLTSIMFNGPQETLTLTYHAQPALLTVSTALLTKFKEFGIEADFVAGHSLGEYSALVAANVMSFQEAVYAVRRRGELMEEAVPAGKGAMAAILGMEKELLTEVTNQVTEEGDLVQLANLNSPSQIVISGTREGVEKASILAKEKGAKRVIPLEVSGPFHSDLMKPAAEELKHVLDGLDIQNASIPVITNVTAKPIKNGKELKEKLVEQLYSPVRWEESVQTMIDLGVTTFIEIGPGKVLSGLVKKVNRRVKTYNIFDIESMTATVAALKEEN
ncbi:ACP S-malonyltransferase [Bacillus alveayuensis]|uniref:Malonyl CoA-acyl carrier protein transacylase n=1 Tax=Aeribacillus alveayuensis TaxID=279215 RepID=A0ABT9VLF7_9BACI|nr:ACP S-malonyltransferase [Bacillus alveayuensis]MDQ0161702.1 [acyl-carrier-protein] S-malonyltransferase [Bacillus alveayuensis]